MAEPLISVRNVNHYFGTGALRKQILFDISTDILPGEIVINTGPSGSGKTTLLTLIGALRSVDEGSIQTLGRELRNADKATMAEVRRGIGYIFQAHNLLDALTASQNVQMSLEPQGGYSRKESRDRAVEMLTAVGLEKHIDKYPRQLSGGQKQRVAIARALARNPKVILADEPTAALDKKSGREVVEILHKLAKDNGCAIMLVTHDNRILDIADRILTLEDGRISSFTSGLAASAGQLLTAFAQLHRKGDLVRHVASLGDKPFLELLEQVTSEFDQFLRTVDIANQEAIDALMDQVLEAVTLRIRDILKADRATLYLVDRRNEVLRSKIAHHEGDRALEIEISMHSGIAGRVAHKGETLNIEDAYNNPDFNPEVDSRSGYRTKQILCMPIYDRKKNVFAVGQLLNKKDGLPFTKADEQKFAEFAVPLGVILESCARLAHDKQSAG
jgi:putative ABC transport system ATP-binding protein